MSSEASFSQPARFISANFEAFLIVIEESLEASGEKSSVTGPTLAAGSEKINSTLTGSPHSTISVNFNDFTPLAKLNTRFVR